MPPTPKQPKRKQLDTPQISIDEQIAVAIADERTFLMEIMGEALGVIQSRLKHRLKRLETEAANLRAELNIERQVNARMQQVEQRHYQRVDGTRVNGHAN